MNVLVYPYYSNPYQRLLYDEVTKFRVNVRYLLGKKTQVLSIPAYFRIAKELVNQRKQFEIFHLHWVAFSLPYANIFKLLLSFLFSLFVITWIKLLGYKLVWTVHNVLPHERQTFNDTFVRDYLLRQADQIIVHTNEVKRQLTELGVVEKKIQVIPIGPYPIQNIQQIEKQVAARSLGISAKKFTFVFFGMIRANKGVVDLLKAYSQLGQQQHNTQLVIAGSCYDQKLKEKIQSFQAKLGTTLRLQLDYIDDKTVGYLYRVADAVVFPFTRITTSSSIPEALGYTKPIIFPDLPELENIPASVGIRYKARDIASLTAALSKMASKSADTSTYAQAAKKYIASFSWKDIAQRTLKTYQSL